MIKSNPDLLPQSESSKLLESSARTLLKDNKSHQYFKIENITVIKPPLLKVFYWQAFDIEGLNGKILGKDNRIEHDFHLPTRHLNSKPLKIVFWLRSLSKTPVHLKLKRVQNCQCQLIKTRVGFNQFRFLYHCHHKRLISVSQEFIELQPNELVVMSMVAYFHILGSYVLSYELSCSDSRVIKLNFHVDIVTLDPAKSVLTRELIPVNVKECRRMSQAIWIRNITMENLEFRFEARDRGFRLINPKMVVPRQSIWPLIVDYRPSDFENELNLIMLFNGMRYNIPLTCKGSVEDFTSESNVPVSDYECMDFLYVVFPNKLEFLTEVHEERSLMVAVHNHNQRCMEFKWQTYSINGYFNLTFEPTTFTLKPHHSKLCMVHCRTYDKPLHFRYLPAVLEIHRILEKSTQIAQQLLTEIESIDDPKWREDSYAEHVFLHIDLIVKFPKIKPIFISSIENEDIASPPLPLMIPMSKYRMPAVKQTKNFTIFEKLFWDYLSRSNFMRNTEKVPRNLTYNEVLQNTSHTKQKPIINDKCVLLDYISCLLAGSCRELSKNYRYVPKDVLETF